MNKKTYIKIMLGISVISLCGIFLLWKQETAQGKSIEIIQKDSVSIMQFPDNKQENKKTQEEGDITSPQEKIDAAQEQAKASSPPLASVQQQPIAELPFTEAELIERGFVKTDIGSLRNPYDPGNGYVILLVKDFWQKQEADTWMQEQIHRTPEFANPFGDYRNYISENQDGSWSGYISKKEKE